MSYKYLGPSLLPCCAGQHGFWSGLGSNAVVVGIRESDLLLTVTCYGSGEEFTELCVARIANVHGIETLDIDIFQFKYITGGDIYPLLRTMLELWLPVGDGSQSEPTVRYS